MGTTLSDPLPDDSCGYLWAIVQQGLGTELRPDPSTPG